MRRLDAEAAGRLSHTEEGEKANTTLFERDVRVNDVDVDFFDAFDTRVVAGRGVHARRSRGRSVTRRRAERR